MKLGPSTSIFLSLFTLFLCSCDATAPSSSTEEKANDQSTEMSCHDSTAVSPRAGWVNTDVQFNSLTRGIDSSDMVFVPGGQYLMGATDDQGRPDEYPLHWVKLSSFWMSKHEITNAQFREFVEATGYKTIAERDVNWEELKDQLAPGTPKPEENLLKAGSLIFSPPNTPVDLHDFSQWWSWQTGADWRHPQGPGSNIDGKDDHPVVQVCWFDAVAYCKWAGVRLPTEAEWEWAARGGQQDVIYSWGNEHVDVGAPKANSWQGNFPNKNKALDGFKTTAPVGSFPPNPFGLYDMSGNAWEWCSDWYRADEYRKWEGDTLFNPQGPSESWDPRDPYGKKRSQRGGSFLCNEQYCSSYRVSARMPGSEDTGMPHVGFRVVVSDQ